MDSGPSHDCKHYIVLISITLRWSHKHHILFGGKETQQAMLAYRPVLCAAPNTASMFSFQHNMLLVFIFV